MHAQASKKKTPTSRGMKNIGMFLPTCATIYVDPKKACVIIVVGPEETCTITTIGPKKLV
jgi:hypothetical protein